MSGREKSAHFRAHYLFWPNFFEPKQCKPRNTIKIVVSTEIDKTKNDTFFLKKVFLTWAKKWVSLTVFLKSCVFLVFSAKHSSCHTKTVCWKKTEKIYEKKWLVFGHGKKVFLFVFCQALVLLWFVFCVSGKVGRVLKMLVFPQFLGLCGAAYSCLFGFGRFRCVCVSCLCFSFCVGFVSVLFALFWFCCWIVFGVGSCFVFVFVIILFFVLFILFCSFCFFWFLGLLFFCFFFFLVFWRVKGSGEVAQRATSLGPKPSLCFLFSFVCL